MRSFDEMGTLGSPSPPSSPSRRPKRWARKCERYCCQTITYFPLVFVYGLTSWAVWVEAGMGFMPNRQCWIGPWSSALGIALYLMLNASYTTAVFTNPGSPSTHQTTAYSHLPTTEISDERFTSLTVKSTGETRFCKKCQSPKPDRAHHCSSCGRCVLKMDHHCPWLATCVGLRNYKAFLLFLIYTSLFCWVCFFVSGSWVWTEIFDDSSYNSSLMPVNYVLLAVISGIIGLVLTGFTAWHIYLTVKGQTTIESLEKTRYLSPLRQRMQNQFNERHYMDGRPSVGDQIQDIHANALPGVTRPEEGVERSSPAASSLRRNWAEMERQRERDRYLDYLDEQDSEKLPNAFDLGWRRNLAHVFGPKRMLWFVPVCNTIGDGWTWEASQKWIEVSDRVAREREAEELRQRQRERDAGWNPNMESPERFFPARTVIDDRYDAQRYVPKTETRFGMPANATNLRNLDRRREIGAIFGEDSDDEDSSDDDDEIVPETRPLRKPQKQNTENWNDIPQEFLPAPGTKPAERRSPSRKRDGDDWQKWNPN